ncbi:MAG: signal peptidase I, partial [Candidatus Aminicenantes bacterium]|nr:signal peptidase I [Candidatus Aminicenantes bacterium]
EIEGIRFYRGHSMKGTFLPGDCLHYKRESLSNISAGDIVIFRKQKVNTNSNELVHRVIARDADRLFTRGDNNPQKDNDPVLTENLVGRVTHFERKGKKYPVLGGTPGFLRARVHHAVNYVNKILKFFFKKKYSLLKKSGVVAYLWHPVLKKISLKTDKGLLVKYLRGKRTVAYWYPDRGYFRCKKPYDLVLRRPDLSGP